MERSGERGEGRESEVGLGWPWLFARAFASSNVSLVLLDRRESGLPIVYASYGFERLTGYTGEQVVGQGLGVLDGPETRPHDAARLESIVRSGGPDQLVVRHHRSDGRPFWDELSLTPVRGVDGGVTHVLCIQADVTQRVDAELARSRSLDLVLRAKNEWEATVDSLGDLVLLVDPRMRVLRANRTLESWKLGTVQSARGRDLHSLLHPRCFEKSCYLVEQWRSSSSASGAVDRSVSDLHLERRLQVTMRGIHGARGGLQSVSVVLRDTSEIHERQEIRLRRDRFEVMGHLVAGLAHEIGNPLAAMKTTLQVWTQNFDRFDRESHRRYLGRLEEGVDGLRATVQRILGRDRRTVERGAASVGVALALERSRRLFEDEALERGLELVVESGGLDGANVVAETSAVDEVLNNLVQNAIEACRRGDRIEVGASVEPESVVVRVRDTGPGIPRDVLGNLFVPFFTTKPRGTGIGLSHVNRLMEAMGGRIEIESAENAGTTATLRFVRAPNELAP